MRWRGCRRYYEGMWESGDEMQYQERMNENEGEFMENEKNVEEKRKNG